MDGANPPGTAASEYGAGEAVAWFSLGVAQAQSSQQRQIVQRLWGFGHPDSLQRRWQRLLANDRVKLAQVFSQWTRWVVRQYEPAAYRLLVEETRLGERLGVMMLARAYPGRSIPLAWWCYEANPAAADPEVGPVGMIQQLLLWVGAGLPEAAQVTVQADRGVGCSPTLAQFVAQPGWYFRVRVTGQTKLVTESGDDTIDAMVQPGEHGHSSGKVFKRRRRIRARAYALGEGEATEPWALVTNHPNYNRREDAQRTWQEPSFRELKSQGWQWSKSQVWRPADAQRRLLVLVLAYAWTLSMGVRVALRGQAVRPKRLSDGSLRRRLRLFQEGLRGFLRLLTDPFPLCPGLWFPANLCIP
jgi:hypothetical protein